MRKQSWLCKPREIELLVGVGKGKLRNIVTKNVAGLCINCSCDCIFLIKIATHTRVLRTLPGEDEENIWFGLTHGDGTGGMGESEE